MPTPTKQKTTQAQTLTYAKAIGWTLVSRKPAEQRRGFNPNVPPADRTKNRSLFFPNLLNTKVREFNPRYAEAAGAAVRELADEVSRELNEDEIAAWQFIVTQKFVTTPELMKQTGFGKRKTQRVLKKFRDSKLLERLGKGPATRYKVLRP